MPLVTQSDPGTENNGIANATPPSRSGACSHTAAQVQGTASQHQARNLLESASPPLTS
ncbi:hypothetical protein AZE42_12975, partial [Rhizopogon vesiculosus]